MKSYGGPISVSANSYLSKDYNVALIGYKPIAFAQVETDVANKLAITRFQINGNNVKITVLNTSSDTITGNEYILVVYAKNELVTAS